MSEYRGVWILAEQDNSVVQRIGFELLARARPLAEKLSTEVTALVLGHHIDPEGLQELIERGADRVVAMEAPQLEYFLCEPYAVCLEQIVADHRPEILIAGATSTGRTLMPYVAARLHCGLTADCTDLDIEPETGDLLQTRPAIGGNIMATIKTPEHRPQMTTVRPRSSPSAPRQRGRLGRIERLKPPEELLRSRIRRAGFVPHEEEHGIQDADVVVTVGRGIKQAGNVSVAQELADLLHGALGATRDVVDRGWLSYPHQIGLSGKTVTPRLYIGAGVSGSIQHLAGMQSAETIVAVNTDPDAPIFRVADFGIVGDLFEVLPSLVDKLRDRPGTPRLTQSASGRRHTAGVLKGEAEP